MKFLIFNDQDHPFKLSIPLIILKLFDSQFRQKQFYVDLNLHWKMAKKLNLSKVEKDFLIKNDESSLLTYISSLHYLQNRNKTSSNILKLFDFNNYQEDDTFHGIVNNNSKSFLKIPDYPMNLGCKNVSSKTKIRTKISEFDVFENSFVINKLSQKNNQNQEIIKQNVINKICRIHNYENLLKKSSICSIFISPVTSVRHNPYPKKWISNQKELLNIKWVKSKYEIEFPTIYSLIAESSKLRTLNNLLIRLKREKHRVLIFCQMTKMMDIIEDYLQFKKYKYYRLDGGSGINDRRDMVNGFQSRNDVFVFLLSTRAGGLGVTLTAADDVIFYDNDWNPTMDAQAEDRAHRIGNN